MYLWYIMLPASIGMKKCVRQKYFDTFQQNDNSQWTFSEIEFIKKDSLKLSKNEKSDRIVKVFRTGFSKRKKYIFPWRISFQSTTSNIYTTKFSQIDLALSDVIFSKMYVTICNTKIMRKMRGQKKKKNTLSVD